MHASMCIKCLSGGFRKGIRQNTRSQTFWGLSNEIGRAADPRRNSKLARIMVRRVRPRIAIIVPCPDLLWCVSLRSTLHVSFQFSLSLSLPLPPSLSLCLSRSRRTHSVRLITSFTDRQTDQPSSFHKLSIEPPILATLIKFGY